MLKQIEECLNKGIYSKKNVRYSENIGVSDNRFPEKGTISCSIITDDIFNIKGELIFNVERHIGDHCNYYDVDIHKYMS